MDKKEALKILKNANRHNSMLGILPGSDIGKVLIKALEDLLEYQQEKQETSKIVDGITECCGYDFRMNAFEHEKPQYCPMCGRKLN